MTHERSDRAWEAYLRASDKFDYFVLGIAGALTAYLGERLNLSPLGWNSSTIQLASVVSLGASMYAGFRRIEWGVVAVGANHRQLHHGEAAGALVDIAQQSDALLNIATGDILPRGEALLRAQQHKLDANAMKQPIDRAVVRAERAYRWRNLLLFLGILLLVAAKVFEAYSR